MNINTTRLSSIHLRKNLSLAWPLALNALLMQSMLIIDILLVSPLGKVSLAAMGIATTIVAFFLGIQIALGNGSQLIVGRIFGAKDSTGLVKAFVSGLVINLIAAGVFIVSLVLWGDSVIALLTPDPNLSQEIRQYLSIAQFIIIVNAFTQVMVVFLNGQGNTKTPFQVYLIELPFNAFVSYFLIFGIAAFQFEGLGVAGAALGSLASAMLRFAFLVKYIKAISIFSNVKLHQHIQFNEVKKHFNEILPIATNFLLLSLGSTLYQLLFSQLDIYAYVAVTLVFPWLRVATQFIVAWAQANAISISQALGQSKTRDINAIIDSSLKLGLILAIMVATALFCFSLCIEFIYPNIEQQTLLALASIVPLYVTIPLFRTYNTIAGNSLRALGKSVQVLKFHFCVQWFVVLPLCSVFVLHLKLPLFWAFILLPLEEVLKIPLFYFMLRKVKMELDTLNSAIKPESNE